MQDVQLYRQRSGAYDLSIARDIGDPELRTERYHCPTWLDYLRQRNRSTQSGRALDWHAIDFHIGPQPVRIRRMLERPFGSVRRGEDETERAVNEVVHGQGLLGVEELGAGKHEQAQTSRARVGGWLRSNIKCSRTERN